MNFYELIKKEKKDIYIYIYIYINLHQLHHLVNLLRAGSERNSTKVDKKNEKSRIK